MEREKDLVFKVNWVGFARPYVLGYTLFLMVIGIFTGKGVEAAFLFGLLGLSFALILTLLLGLIGLLRYPLLVRFTETELEVKYLFQTKRIPYWELKKMELSHAKFYFCRIIGRQTKALIMLDLFPPERRIPDEIKERAWLQFERESKWRGEVWVKKWW